MKRAQIHIFDQFVSKLNLIIYINNTNYYYIELYLGFLDNGQYIILCATKQQLRAISELTHIEIDMAFKRIHGITNEWEVSAYLSRVQKSKLNF
jgi:hypothetical protein